MKRLILMSVIACLFAGGVSAQDATEPILLNKKTLEKKVASSDAKIQDPKKGVKSNTWTARGKLFQDVDNQGLEQAYIGMQDIILKKTYGEPLSEPVADEDNNLVYKYETINYYFKDDQLRAWTRIEPIAESPLKEAYNSYIKSIELTEKAKQLKLQEKIKPKLVELKEQFKRSGQNNYYLKNYEAALCDFEHILKINDIEIFNGEIDTLMINYAGIVAREYAGQLMEDGKTEKGAEMYKKTISLYDKLTEIGSGGSSTYLQMTRDFYAIGDTLGAINNLKKGLEKYPDSSVFVSVIAQAYYISNDNKSGLEFVNNRIETKPDDAVSYYWKGLMITNKKDVGEETIDSALALYNKSIELDPSNGNVWYQTGYVNYAVGANYFEQESIEDDEEYRKELSEKGNKYYAEAVEKLEGCYEITANDLALRKESLDLLKRIYYKLYGSEDQRYLDVSERLKNLYD